MLILRRNLMKTLGMAAAAGVTPLARLSAAAYAPAPGFRTGLMLLGGTGSAYGPSAKVITALQSALSVANLYAADEYEALADQIATLHGVQRSEVLLGCGSSEILRMAACAFLGKGKRLVIAAPSFDTIAYYAALNSTEVVRVPLNRQHNYDFDAMLTRATAPGVVYISYPNSPAGTLASRSQLEAFIRKLPADIYVVVDEAYYHYAAPFQAYASFIDHPLDDPRIIVTRTFSKVHAMAGMRLGYGIASPRMVEQMLPYRLQLGVNTLAARAGMAALADAEGVNAAVKRNADDRQDFINRAQIRMYNPLFSHTNFVMLNTEMPAGKIVEHFAKNNILLGGPFPPMDTFIRVSLGTPSQMQEFWRVWDLLHINKTHH